MQRKPLLAALFFAMTARAIVPNAPAAHSCNDWYSGNNLDQGGFPLGGIGAGMICMDSTGSISRVSVRNHMQFFNEPIMFAAILERIQQLPTVPGMAPS